MQRAEAYELSYLAHLRIIELKTASPKRARSANKVNRPGTLPTSTALCLQTQNIFLDDCDETAGTFGHSYRFRLAVEFAGTAFDALFTVRDDRYFRIHDQHTVRANPNTGSTAGANLFVHG